MAEAPGPYATIYERARWLRETKQIGLHEAHAIIRKEDFEKALWAADDWQELRQVLVDLLPYLDLRTAR